MIIALHIAAGSLALVSLFVPIVAKKGSRLHKRGGYVFVAAMGVLAITAAIRIVERFIEGDPSRVRSSLFLGFISVLATQACIMGVRVLRVRGRPSPWDWSTTLILGVCSVALLVYGLTTQSILFGIFALLGFVQSATQLRHWLRGPTSDAKARLREHIGSMGSASISALTAFVVVNARHMALPPQSLWAWVAPGVVGGVVVGWAQRKYASHPPSGGEATETLTRGAPIRPRQIR